MSPVLTSPALLFVLLTLTAEWRLLGSIQEFDPVSSYTNSPIETHRWFRHQAYKGVNISGALKKVALSSGDASFEGLDSDFSRIKPLLEMQKRAIELWEQQEYKEASRLYEAASKGFSDCGARGEAAICCYFIAEILAEQERFSLSLEWSQKGLSKLDFNKHLYASALLYESRAYAFWFLDMLPESAACFSAATKAWSRVGFRQGIGSCWNNLGSLYEELLAFDLAEDCYVEALSFLEDESSREPRFFVLLNLARLANRRQKPNAALSYLSAAHSLEKVSPSDFRLAQAEILKSKDSIQNWTPDTPSLAVEKYLILGDLSADNGTQGVAGHHYHEALQLARKHLLHIYSRQASLRLGSLLERQLRYGHAIDVYRSALDFQNVRTTTDGILPFWKASEPLFDGLVRCLVHLGRDDIARREIHSQVTRRRAGLKTVIRNKSRFGKKETRIEQFAQFYSGDRPGHEHQPGFSTPESPNDSPGFVRIEMWPQDDRVFTWVDGPEGTTFYQIVLSSTVSEIIGKVTPTFQIEGTSLPPLPDKQILTQLSQQMIEPIEHELVKRRVQLIPHKEMQAFPFELLQVNGSGLLGIGYSLSYLPSNYPSSAGFPIPDPPIILIPEPFESREGAKRELRFFMDNFRDIRRFTSLSDALPRMARWMHLSAHAKLDPGFWITSELHSGQTTIPTLELANSLPRCRLLSLAVCNLASGLEQTSSSWMGFSELFLAAGADSLLISRWPVAEAATPLFLEFFRFVQSGVSLDDALKRARRSFVRGTIKKDQAEVPASHPFFWSGIVYVGEPGLRLYPMGLRLQSERFLGMASGLATGLAIGILHCLLKLFSGPRGIVQRTL